MGIGGVQDREIAQAEDDLDRSDLAATEHAILLTPDECGWRWRLLDANGIAVAGGVSADQSHAMESARRAMTVSP